PRQLPIIMIMFGPGRTRSGKTSDNILAGVGYVVRASGSAVRPLPRRVEAVCIVFAGPAVPGERRAGQFHRRDLYFAGLALEQVAAIHLLGLHPLGEKIDHTP